MRLTERHIIKKSHDLFNECDSLCFKAKNLYNFGLYQVRQHFFETGKFYSGYSLCKDFKYCDDYKALPSKISSGVLINMSNGFVSFFGLHKAWKKHPDKFTKKPKIPSYKHKTEGRFMVGFERDAISKKVFDKTGKIKLSKVSIEFSTSVSWESLRWVRIIPRQGYYVIEVVYSVSDIEVLKDNKCYASVDLGLDNLATVVSNVGSTPYIVNGKPLKSINQFYNKRRAALQSKLPKEKKRSKRLDRLTLKRNCKVDNYLHKASKTIVQRTKDQGCNSLVVGLNKEWKQNINIGKRNNQNFVSIPHSRFVLMLRYKCEREGIRFILREESYTSKCSFLDHDEVRKHESYKGKRISRGLFRSASGCLINADVNGAYNILIKAFPKAFTQDGVEGVLVHPEILHLCA